MQTKFSFTSVKINTDTVTIPFFRWLLNPKDTCWHWRWICFISRLHPASHYTFIKEAPAHVFTWPIQGSLHHLFSTTFFCSHSWLLFYSITFPCPAKCKVNAFTWNSTARVCKVWEDHTSVKTTWLFHQVNLGTSIVTLRDIREELMLQFRIKRHSEQVPSCCCCYLRTNFRDFADFK